MLTDDQAMLRDTARELLADEGAIAKQLRHWRDTGCTDGFGTACGSSSPSLGLTGICIPESDGGLGLGAVEAGMVLEEIGRNLTPSPFLTTRGRRGPRARGHGARRALVPGHPLRRDGRRAGDRRRASTTRPKRIAMAAKRSGNGFALSGAKQFVVQGASADVILVAARTAGSPGETEGITLFAVEKGASGLEVENVALADSSKARG